MKTVIGFIVLLIIEIIAFCVIRKRMIIRERKKAFRLSFLLIFVILWLITAKFIVFPPIDDIPTHGEYEITSEDYWVTEDVTDPYTNEGFRQIQIRKWYPVDCDEEHPVIIASHGSCGTIDNNISLYRELASHGYIVLAVAHPGQAVRVVYENGKSSGPSGVFLKQMSVSQPNEDPEYALGVFVEWMNIRTTDLNAVMDDYLAKNGRISFIVMGHSLGGSAAYAMARSREDVIGCIALESPFMDDIIEVVNGEFVFDDRDYSVPLLNIYSDSSYYHLREWRQYGNNARFLDADNDNYTNIHYAGVGHMGLCDLSHISPLLASVLDGRIYVEDTDLLLIRMNKDCLDWIQQIERSL